MKILDRYILKKYIGTFVYAISLLIVVVIIFDVSENIEDFLKNNAPIKEIIVDYYINFIPYFINLFIYLFIFISVIFFTSKMAGNTEIIAILSSGISFTRFLYPYLLGSIMVGIVSLYLGNFLIPQTNEIRRDFRQKYVENLHKDAGRNIHVQTEKGVFVYVESYNNKKHTGNRFTIEKFQDQELVYKLIADRIDYDSTGLWRISNYTERFIDGTNEYIVKGKTKDTLITGLKPTDLYTLKHEHEIMNFWELREHIAEEKLKGSKKVTVFELEMHNRIASPVAIIILTFIGAALSSRKVRGGIGMHLGLGIVITFSYILFMQFSNVFATFGNLSPVLAAWIPNILYAILCIYLIRTAPK